MMKCYIYILLLFFAAAVSCSSKEENRKRAEYVFEQELDSLSFDEIKRAVLEANLQFSFFYAFMGEDDDDDKPQKYDEDDERYDSPFTLSSMRNQDDFVDKITFSQSLDYPNSRLRIDSEVKEGNGESITYFLDRIYYSDQTSDSLDTSISSYHTLDLRRADSITITVRYRCVTELDRVELSPSSKDVKYKDGTISVMSAKDNNIQYAMSDDISGYFVDGQAVSESDKLLSRSGYSSGDLPPKELKAKYKKVFKALEKIATKVKEDKYKTKEQLVDDIYGQMSSLNFNTESDKYYRSEYYYGNVKGLVLYFAKDRKTEDYTFTIPIMSTIGKYNLIFDNNTGNNVIVDNTGKTIVSSVLKDVEQINDYYYKLINYNDDEVLFLNIQTNSLNAVKPYKSANISYLTNELALLSYRDKYGVLGKDGSLIIPAIYDNIEVNSENILVAMDNKTFRFFDSDANLLVEGKGTISSYADGLAIHRSANGDNIAFVDRKGKAVLSISQYSRVEPFVEGLAIVEKNRKWGAIRKDGSVAIPFEYDDILNFSSGVTMVTVGGKRGLINKDNEFVLPLENVGSYGTSESFGRRTYFLGKKSYDEKGRLKEDDNE